MRSKSRSSEPSGAKALPTSRYTAQRTEGARLAIASGSITNVGGGTARARTSGTGSDREEEAHITSSATSSVAGDSVSDAPRLRRPSLAARSAWATAATAASIHVDMTGHHCSATAMRCCAASAATSRRSLATDWLPAADDEQLPGSRVGVLTDERGGVSRGIAASRIGCDVAQPPSSTEYRAITAAHLVRSSRLRMARWRQAHASVASAVRMSTPRAPNAMNAPSRMSARSGSPTRILRVASTPSVISMASPPSKVPRYVFILIFTDRSLSPDTTRSLPPLSLASRPQRVPVLVCAVTECIGTHGHQD
jgi:hypothetical protein